MRFTVSSEEHKHFHTLGYIELEELLSSEEATILLGAIRAVKGNTPGYPEENLYRSIPTIPSLARKRGWGQIASELLHKKPLRIAYDKFFETPPTALQPVDEESCALLLNLTSRSGYFFKESIPLYNTQSSCYFLLIFTARHLPDRLNPIVFR